MFSLVSEELAVPSEYFLDLLLPAIRVVGYSLQWRCICLADKDWSRGNLLVGGGWGSTGERLCRAFQLENVGFWIDCTTSSFWRFGSSELQRWNLYSFRWRAGVDIHSFRQRHLGKVPKGKGMKGIRCTNSFPSITSGVPLRRRVRKALKGKRPSAHRNRDARRFMKSNVGHHGYGSHTVSGSRLMFIRKGIAVDAGFHGGNVPARQLPKDGRGKGGLFADSARRSAGTGAELKGGHTGPGFAGVGAAGTPLPKGTKGGTGAGQKRAAGQGMHTTPGRGAKVLFHGMGIVRAKVYTAPMPPPMNTARSICRFCHEMARSQPGHGLRRGCSPPTPEKGVWRGKTREVFMKTTRKT